MMSEKYKDTSIKSNIGSINNNLYKMMILFLNFVNNNI